MVPASHVAPVSNWRGHVGLAVRALESQLEPSAQTPEAVARHAQLRMLYLLADRRDDAMRPIPSVAPAMQDFWKKELYGLSAWLDVEGTPDAAQRAAEAKRVLAEAAARLAESAPLEARNLAFCTAIDGYGCITPFDKMEFVPGQEVLLYAEVDNFTSEETPRGFHTTLRSGYQIFDSRGQRVIDRDFPKTEEYCRNARHDFFIGYRLALPAKHIYPGKHTLQLTIEDIKSRKIGQASIEFVLKSP